MMNCLNIWHLFGVCLLSVIVWNSLFMSDEAVNETPLNTIAAGREVYISEGCIHCHSQYVRPDSELDRMWGTPRDLGDIHQDNPVLAGNRRQGPDLSNVGYRRPREWNRQHLINPQAMSDVSRMPSYEHLFEEGNQRGEWLLDYLASLRNDVILDDVEE